MIELLNKLLHPLGLELLRTRNMKMINYRSLKHWKYQLMEIYECCVPESCCPVANIWNPFISMTDSGALKISKGYCWDGPSGQTSCCAKCVSKTAWAAFEHGTFINPYGCSEDGQHASNR